jgi:hypothetical protein
MFSCSSDETSTPVTPPPTPIAKYTITFSAGDGGSVSTTGGEYEKGQTVTVTATPQGEYVFTSWSDGITDATRTVTIDATKTITANFEKKKYALTVNIEGEGEVLEEIVNAGRTTDYDSGTTVKLSAVPADGWEFVGWKGAIESTELEVQLLVSESKEVVAEFKRKTFNLYVDVIGNGVVNENFKSFRYGDEVKLFSTPNDNFFFSKWDGYLESQQDTINLVIIEDVNLTASFFEMNNCLEDENDVFNGIEFLTVNTTGNKNYNCLIVNKSDGHPVIDGNESARFELRSEEGDCGYTPEGFSDCDTDRSRHELYEQWIPEYDNIEGKILTYEYSLYIPEIEYFTPTSDVTKRPLTVLSQVFSQSEGENRINDEINTSVCDPKALLYFIMENNTLKYVTHKPFTWYQNDRITIRENPFNEWINIKIEIKASVNNDGYIKLYINNELINSDMRPTLCALNNTSFALKLGIYNAYVSDKNSPFLKQVVYYDDVKRSISQN